MKRRCESIWRSCSSNPAGREPSGSLRLLDDTLFTELRQEETQTGKAVDTRKNSTPTGGAFSCRRNKTNRDEMSQEHYATSQRSWQALSGQKEDNMLNPVNEAMNSNAAELNNVTIIENNEGGTKMFELMKLNVLNKTVTKVPFPTTAALEWADRLGRADNMFLLIDHSFDKQKNENSQKNLDYILNNGITIKGIHYVWVMAGSSQLRKANCTFIDETMKEEFLHWALCGVDDRRNLVANKTLVYRALSMSSTYSWCSKLPRNKFYGLMTMPNIDKVGVFKDINSVVNGVFDVVENDQVSFSVERNVEYKISDGIAYYIVDDEKLNSYEKVKLLKELESFTFRAPGFKGLMVPVLKSVLRNWIKFNKYNPVVKDFWGNEQNIMDLEVITFGSVFKWSKCIDNFSVYQKAFKELGHEFRVCVTAHKRMGDIPYQQMQTLQLNDRDADLLAKAAAKKMHDYSSAPYKLLAGAMSNAVELLPALLQDKFVFNCASQSYTSKRWSISGGRIPEVSLNPFAAPDTVAVFEALLGNKPEGVIAANHVYCNLFKANIDVDVTRCPHLDNAHCIRTVDKAEDTKLGFFIGSTMYFSCHDATMGALQMDFDGDHVNVTDNKFLVTKAKEAVSQLKNNPLYYEAKGSKASYATDEQIVTLLSAIEPAPVGLYANTLTKLWANGVHTEKEKEEAAILTEGANSCIDAAKYISGNSVEAAGFRGVRLIEEFHGIKLPEFHAYAKSSAFVKHSLEDRMEKSAFYPQSCLDQYSRKFRAYCPETLVVEGIEDLQFDASMLVAKEYRRVPGLRRIPDGFFDRLVIANQGEQQQIETMENPDVREELAKINAEQIRKQVFDYAASVGCTETDAVNTIVSSVYIQKNAPEAIKRVIWNCFGEDIVANIKANMQ